MILIFKMLNFTNLIICFKQNGESGNRMQLLSHHLSLPNASSTASDMVTVDKYMQLQDSVPCRIRAKRGCATHPRSIAERVSFNNALLAT